MKSLFPYFTYNEKSHSRQKACKMIKKIGYHEYFTQIKKLITYEDTIPNNLPPKYSITFSHIEFQEIYSRGDNKRIKKMFKNILKLCDKKNPSFFNSKRSIEKCIKDLKDGSYSYSLQNFPELKLNINDKYINHISISFKSVGPSFFTIRFFCFPKDDFLYKYWNILITDFKKEIFILRNKSFKREIFYSDGANRKKEELLTLEKSFYKASHKLVKKIGKGIFYQIFKEIPSTLITSITNCQSWKLHSKKTDNSFFNIFLEVDSDHGERYIGIHPDMPIFLAYPQKKITYSKLINRFVRTRDIVAPFTEELSWLSIVNYLYHYQMKLIDDVKNDFYHLDFFQKKINFNKQKKKINKINSLIDIIKNHDELEDTYNSKSIPLVEVEYIYTPDNIRAINYKENFKLRNSFILKKISERLPIIEKLYENRYKEINTRNNTRIQYFILLLTALTLFFTIPNLSINCKSIVNRTYNCIVHSIEISHELRVQKKKIQEKRNKLLEVQRNIRIFELIEENNKRKLLEIEKLIEERKSLEKDIQNQEQSLKEHLDKKDYR